MAAENKMARYRNKTEVTQVVYPSLGESVVVEPGATVVMPEAIGRSLAAVLEPVPETK